MNAFSEGQCRSSESREGKAMLEEGGRVNGVQVVLYNKRINKQEKRRKRKETLSYLSFFPLVTLDLTFDYILLLAKISLHVLYYNILFHASF